MAKKRREKDAASIKLKQPDRSAPSDQTLLQFAQERNLFAEAEARQRKIRGEQHPAAKEGTEVSDDEDEGEAALSPRAERILNTLLYSVSLTMLHATFDVLVMNQYAIRIKPDDVVYRAAIAFAGRPFSSQQIQDDYGLTDSSATQYSFCLSLFSMRIHPIQLSYTASLIDTRDIFDNLPSS